MPGPIPNHSSDLSRERDADRGDRVPMKMGELRPSAPLPLDIGWHPSAKALYGGMIESGQSDFFQQSDWAYLHFLCGQMSAYANAGKISGQFLSALDSALSRLLVTEGDRRRARIELAEPQGEPTATRGQATVSHLRDSMTKRKRTS